MKEDIEHMYISTCGVGWGERILVPSIGDSKEPDILRNHANL